MVTKRQAMTLNEFHHNTDRTSDGRCRVYRRNGATQTWKTRPDEFRTPVKTGFRDTWQLTELNADQFHAPGECTNPKMS